MEDEPMLKNRKMTREQIFEAQRMAEEQEKEKMKQIMISICTFLEEKYFIFLIGDKIKLTIIYKL